MISRLIRQRRRLVFVMISASLGTFLVSGAGSLPVLCGGLAGAGTAAGILTAPRVRRWCEAAGLGYVTMALLPLPLAVLPPVFVIGTLAAFHLLYGRWADRIGLRLGLDSHRRSQVNQPAATVWTALLPGEGHPDDHWSGQLLDFDHDKDDADTVYLRFHNGTDLYDDATLTYLERVPGKSCRYLLESSEPHGQDDRTMTLCLVDIGPDTTQINSRMQQDDLPPRLAIARRFDDAFGDELDSFAATLSARRDWSIKGLGRGIRTPPPAQAVEP